MNRRAATHDAGRDGENLAAWALRLKGYRILARNFRAGPGEVDIVARAPGFGPIPVLAFVEVKFRPDTAAAAEAISADKRRRVIRAAEGFVAARPRYANAVLRFDAMFVAPGSWPRHVPDAWQA